MKNSIKALILSSLILFPHKDANAIVGIYTGSIPVAVVGAILIGYDLTMAKSRLDNAVSELLGLLLLKGDNDQSIQFASIPESGIFDSDVSPEEAKAFNGDLNRLNALTQEIQSKIADLPADSQLAAAKTLWNTARTNQELSPTTFAVLDKLGHSTKQ